MSKKIYMIRHGESMGNAWEYAYNHEEMNFLTNLGQQQARAAGKTLLKNKVQIDEWHCSKMVRARHTLSLISSEIGCWKTEFPQTRYNLHMDLNENHTWASPSDHANAVGQFVSRVVNPFLNSHSEAQTLGIVSHYYTMDLLFTQLSKKFGFTRFHIDGYQDYIPNGHVFCWDMNYPKEIRGLEEIPDPNHKYR